MEHKIFAGKGAKNNELIIKILFEKGSLSAWKIAKELANLDPKKPRDMYHKAQKIQSVLIRKKGRLEDLVVKGFIQKIRREYSLTFDKGFCSALVLFGDKQIPKPALDEFHNSAILPQELKDFMSILSSYNVFSLQESYREIQGVTISLLEKGLNFEKIPNREFSRFFSDQYEEYSLQLLRDGKKSKANAEWTPELKEAAQKFITKMSSIVQEKAKELQELSTQYRLDLERKKDIK
jgi:hypothetical protein